ncbi:hypothetical protein HZC07_05880 [Candidatus Micrarchaeota archaeon]|nr:hypothetical protein [Candidatus Micrarchaeota archaeon]
MILVRNFWIVSLLFVFAAQIVYADVGPAPDPPKVLVHLETGGKPEIGVTEVTYHCLNSNTNASGSMSQRTAALKCFEGTCTNAESIWFYKFNPCFNFPEGFFSYNYNGKEIQSDKVKFTDKFDKYEITIDVPKGGISNKMGSSLPASCSSGFIISLIAIGMFAVGRK